MNGLLIETMFDGLNAKAAVAAEDIFEEKILSFNLYFKKQLLIDKEIADRAKHRKLI